LPLIDVDHFDRLGLEGLITFSKDSHEYDAEQYQLAVPNSEGNKVDISVFDTVVVDISLEKDKQTQRSKVKMALVSPADSEQQQMYSSTLQFTIFRRGIVTRSTFFTRRRRPHCRNCRAHASGTCSASLFFPRPRSLAVPHLRSAIDEPPPPAVLQVVGASEGPTGLVIFGTVSSGRRVRVSFQRMTLLRRCTTVVRAAMSG
jgi:hypothetical protein